jgi:hypothetical protein
MNINLYINDFINLWERSSVLFPNLGEEIPLAEKIKREEELVQFSKNVKSNAITGKSDPYAHKELKLQFKQNIMAFAKNAFNFEDRELAMMSEKGFTSATKDFMRMARNFDPDVKMEDVFQACRNLWIINSLQIMMNEPVQVTPSVFAYSMLYPYSDNYLDDPSITKQEKIDFSKRFRMRLCGEIILPKNRHERSVFDLVSMIESDWNREIYPNVYESLLAIQDAQTRSILLVSNKNGLTSNDLLSICIEKGGTSVLADGYLINGIMTKEQEWFCFGFGTFLQFIDDIQDLKEDMDSQLETIFTYAARTGNLEEFTNRTLSFSNEVMNDLSCFPSEELDSMKGLMIKSINFMTNEAVGLNQQCFGREYFSTFERFSPFTYTFVKKRRNHIEPNRISIMKKIEEFVFPQYKSEELIASR